jgi:carboxypeptidase PM20D1
MRIKRFLQVSGAVVACLVATICLRTLTLTSRQLSPAPPAALKFGEDRAVQTLQQSVRLKTLSDPNAPQASREAFGSFHELLRKTYPKVHATLKQEVVSESSLLYTWTGSHPNAKPILLIAHMDVVPAGAKANWSHPAFSGDLADGFIWGRGTLDDKESVLGILEAAEALLTEGFRPRRTVYLAFGHDEETSGLQGATRMAALLRSRNIKVEICLDEGMAILEGVLPGVIRPVAMIGVAEKGYLSLELTVEGQGGHSSQPPRETVIGILSKAVARLEDHPQPGQLRDPTRYALVTLAPEMPFGLRLIMANLWLFQRLVEHQLEGSKTTAATLRSTMATTIIGGGTKENVLPARASAVLNCRLLPGDTVDLMTATVRRTIADDRVHVRALGKANNASPVSSVTSPGYVMLETTVRQVFPDALVAPGLVLGATDSRNFSDLTETTFRFSPLRLNAEDMARIHGANERISRDDYLKCIRFYGQFIRNAAS